MSDAARQELARAAGLGDRRAARRLLSLLDREREKSSEWWSFPNVIRKRLSGPRREVVVRLRHQDLSALTAKAWRNGEPEEFAEALQLELRQVQSWTTVGYRALPEDVELLAVWDEVATRLVCVLVGHPSFELVRDGDECPRFVGHFVGQEPWIADVVRAGEAERLDAVEQDFRDMRYEPGIELVAEVRRLRARGAT